MQENLLSDARSDRSASIGGKSGFPKALSLYYANVSCYGPQAKTYIFAKHILESSILMFVEMYLVDGNKHKFLSDLKQAGYRVCQAPSLKEEHMVERFQLSNRMCTNSR